MLYRTRIFRVPFGSYLLYSKVRCANTLAPRSELVGGLEVLLWWNPSRRHSSEISGLRERVCDGAEWG